jgi:hypothetical protein
VLNKSFLTTLLLISCAVVPLYGYQTTSLKAISKFKNSKLQEISPDGRLLLFYETNRPMRMYTIRSDGSTHTSKTSNDMLRLIERTSGRELGRIRVEFYPDDIQLIPGTQRVLYTEPKLVQRKLEWRLKIWDVGSGEARECSSENVVDRSFSLVDAQHGLTLVRSVDGDSFSSLSLPGCSQGMVSPVDPSNLNARIDGDISFSPGRKEFAYVAANKLIVRDSATLDVLRKINQEAELKLGQSPIYTPDGRSLVVLATNTIFDKPETKRFLFFYDTTSYELVKRLDITNWKPPEVRDDVTVQSNFIGTAMAIGPDSTTIAVGYIREKTNLFGRTEQAQVVIYDLATGQEIAWGSHPKIKQHPDDPFAARIGKLGFTPDGRHLLSTTNDTLVWDVSRSSFTDSQFRSSSLEYLVPLPVSSSASPLSVIWYIQTPGETETAP